MESVLKDNPIRPKTGSQERWSFSLAPVICGLSKQVVSHGSSFSKHVFVDLLPTGVTEEQLDSLLQSSSRCSQYLLWECKGATLTDYNWWVSRQGERMTYWGGGDDRYFCGCLRNRSCDRGEGHGSRRLYLCPVYHVYMYKELLLKKRPIKEAS